MKRFRYFGKLHYFSVKDHSNSTSFLGQAVQGMEYEGASRRQQQVRLERGAPRVRLLRRRRGNVERRRGQRVLQQRGEHGRVDVVVSQELGGQEAVELLAQEDLRQELPLDVTLKYTNAAHSARLHSFETTVRST